MRVEMTLARHTVARMAWVGPPLLVIMGLARGTDGLVASIIGLAIVAGYFLLTGAMLSVSAAIAPAAYHAAALLGFFVRMALVALSMLAVAAWLDVDRLALGVTVVVAYLVLLAWEAVAVSEGRERELEWSS